MAITRRTEKIRLSADQRIQEIEDAIRVEEAKSRLRRTRSREFRRRVSRGKLTLVTLGFVVYDLMHVVYFIKGSIHK